MSPRPAVLLLALFAAAPALTPLAGCATTKSGKGASSSERIANTGIASFDEVFGQAASIDETLRTAKTNLKSGRNDINAALGLKDGTPLADALEELKSKAGDKLELVKEGTTPTLKAKDAVPSNVQSAVDSVNSYIRTLNDTATALATVPDDARSLVGKVQDFPEQLQKDFKSWDISLKDLPDTLSQVKTNVEVTKNLPDKAEGVVNQAKKNLSTIGAAFGGSASGGGGDGAESGGSMSTGKSSGSTSDGAKTAAPKPNKGMKRVDPDDDDED
jgi:uncharacterized phage infection (PIP) family protein YhgE